MRCCDDDDEDGHNRRDYHTDGLVNADRFRRNILLLIIRNRITIIRTRKIQEANMNNVHTKNRKYAIQIYKINKICI